MRRTTAVAALAVAAAAVGFGALASCSEQPGSTAKFCAHVAKVPALESTLARFSETDPDVLNERIEKARDAYHELTEVAPSKIDTDTDKVVALVDEVLDAAADNPSDPGEASDQLRAAMAEHEDAVGARERVAAYAEEHCDVQLDPTLTQGPPTTAPGATTTTMAGSSTTVPATGSVPTSDSEPAGTGATTTPG